MASKKKNLILFGVLLLVGILVYANSINGPFHYDDVHTIEKNPYVKNLEMVFETFVDGRAFSTLPENSSYRPMSSLFYGLCWAVGGGKTWPFHLFKILLHVLCAWLSFIILVRVFRDVCFSFGQYSENAWPPVPPSSPLEIFKKIQWQPSIEDAFYLGALYFVIHPGLSETVNYISATSTLQTACFYLAAVWFYLRSIHKKWNLVWMGLAFVFALFSKEEAATLPAVIALFILTLKPKGLPLSQWLKPRWAGLFVSAVLLTGFLFLYRELAPETGALSRNAVTPLNYFFTQVYAWFYYLAWIFRPWGYAVDHTSFGFSQSWKEPRVWISFAMLFFTLGVCLKWTYFKTGPNRKLFAFGLLWYFITILPGSSVVPLAEPINEHRYYLSYTMLYGVLSAVLLSALFAFEQIKLQFRMTTGKEVLFSLRTVVIGFLLVFSIFGLSAITIHRNWIWNSAERLWKDTVEKDANNGRASSNLGAVYMINGRMAEAAAQFEECARRWPNYKYCYVNQHLAYLKLGRKAEAKAALDKALSIEPSFLSGLELRGKYELEEEKNPAQALQTLSSCKKVSDGKYVPCLKLMVQAARQLGDVYAISSASASLLALDPKDHETRFTRGLASIQEKNYARASEDFVQIVQDTPGDHLARYNLAWVAMQLEDWATAKSQFIELSKLTPDDHKVWTNLRYVASKVSDTATVEKSALELERLKKEGKL